MNPTVDTEGLSGEAIGFRLDEIERAVQTADADSDLLLRMLELERALTKTKDPSAGMRRLVGIRRTLGERDAKRFAAERQQIRAGTLRGQKLADAIDAASDRDEFIERLLGVRFLPVTMKGLGDELVPYVPSGIDAIREALQQARVGDGDTFVDLGSGCGKVTMLANLLTGARATGVEMQPELAAFARARAEELGAEGVSFINSDARDSLPAASVYYLYLPFTGQVLDEVMAQMQQHAQQAPVRVCALGLDLERYAWLVPVRSSFWLTVYESAPPSHS